MARQADILNPIEGTFYDRELVGSASFLLLPATTFASRYHSHWRMHFLELVQW